MTKLSDLYNEFFRIDLDAPGGYARVADVLARQKDGGFVHRAFKLMRHELSREQVGMRFENELKILAEISKDNKAPSAITRIYDSGFVEAELSNNLHTLHEREKQNPNHHEREKLNPTPSLEIVSTGLDIQKFLEARSFLNEKEPDRWVPYLVLDLAPYDDSLRRQIKAQSIGDFVNIYALPVNTIVEMALQILDVMDYLQKKLRYAYIDWKPEHIYWNEASRQLKLIDWNVTTHLDSGPTETKAIREDIRMFSGAALYCSLALTDPEDLIKPIGPPPALPRHKVPPIPPRYWTDKPNFYQRDEILDEEIKRLVQKALDPNQGFNSPKELKNALFQYIEQNYKQTGKDIITGLPSDAVQYFRRARSYIAASDFTYAKIWLELAIEAARKAGAIYSDAEHLRDLLAVNETKQKVKPFLEKKEWKEALDLYSKAIELDPTNIILKKEFDSLQNLLQAELKLQSKGILKIFMPSSQLRAVLEAAREVVDSDNPLLNYVKKQLKQIRLIQISSVVTVFVAILVLSFLYMPAKFSGVFPVATDTMADTPTYISSATSIATSALPSATVLAQATTTETPTVVLEPSITSTPMVVVLKRYTYPIAPLQEPNGNYMEILLPARQPLTVVEKIEYRGRVWYKCSWKTKGVIYEGWFLGEYVEFEPTPTLTP